MYTVIHNIYTYKYIYINTLYMYTLYNIYHIYIIYINIIYIYIYII